MEQTKEKNWKRLFKWERGDWLWLVIFILILFSAYSYQRDTALCREIVKEPCNYCIIDQHNERVRKSAPEIFNSSQADELLRNIGNKTEKVAEN
jgi:hypothetical protein